MIDRLVYDPLITVDATGKKEIPVLAAEVPTLENGGISKDGLTVTYKLRHEVKWHDGEPFTSKDVKFTWQAIMNPANNVSTRSGYNLVRSIDTPDDHTAVFHLKQRFSPAVNTFFAESDTPMFIIPEHLLGNLPNINTAAFNNQPVGTVPFKFSKWVRGDHLEFVPNDDYFMGKPKLQKIIIKIIPDENTEMNQLRTHEIDWIFETSPQLYGQLKNASPDIKNLLIEHNQYEGILFNMTNPILADPKVRIAIAKAIDKQAMVTKLTYDSANAADDEHPDFMWAHVGGKTYPYDPAAARALLGEAGWKPGPDGVMQKNGRRLSLSLVYNHTNVTRRSGVVLIQAYLKAVGIETLPKSYLGTQLFAPKGAGGILSNAKYDLNMSGWVAGIDPDDSVLFMCRSFPPEGNNYTLYCNHATDAAENQALEHYDEATRKKAYETIQTRIYEDMPQDFLWWPRQVQSISVDFKGFAPNPVNEAWNSWEWEI
ncbi:MAG: peptide ABC transporter substrate-binding protein [Candidatus Eremiobacteraeota bacterium]|nr:peptide ABC transporter substrate-binding protein [Candidatus Eremiobacteraeota bacterium]